MKSVCNYISFKVMVV